MRKFNLNGTEINGTYYVNSFGKIYDEEMYPMCEGPDLVAVKNLLNNQGVELDLTLLL